MFRQCNFKSITLTSSTLSPTPLFQAKQTHPLPPFTSSPHGGAGMHYPLDPIPALVPEPRRNTRKVRFRKCLHSTTVGRRGIWSPKGQQTFFGISPEDGKKEGPNRELNPGPRPV
ncbi:hypothetical protein PGT21_033384 [Puccinia graminis f. sp. tritici]|uniref:Uncharacterized protein n=1 Tax=Puccinia graminis f. sp. tritici TaxID=56615 RepID=A0A5B0MXP9_PUCGR|nr:hypothetical protein PGT21_033384 [Puccinia graminis f. sp. tritici]KAA1130251.1 hypothetical protein PGTUg99_017866 [Puccinia graminis f. sp. tritici]